MGKGRFAAEHPEYPAGLIGSGSNGTKAYLAEIQGDSVVVKKFEMPISPDKMAKLKDMESHKGLVLIRGVVVSDDPLAKSQVWRRTVMYFLTILRATLSFSPSVQDKIWIPFSTPTPISLAFPGK
jgi:hypothetical protein